MSFSFLRHAENAAAQILLGAEQTKLIGAQEDQLIDIALQLKAAKA